MFGIDSLFYFILDPVLDHVVAFNDAWAASCAFHIECGNVELEINDKCQSIPRRYVPHWIWLQWACYGLVDNLMK